MKIEPWARKLLLSQVVNLPSGKQVTGAQIVALLAVARAAGHKYLGLCPGCGNRRCVSHGLSRALARLERVSGRKP